MLALSNPHMATSYAEDDSFTVYDTHGRQKDYVESVVQRKERIEFLKQREWVRRVTEWVRQTNAQKDLVRKLSLSITRRSYSRSRSSVVRPDRTSLSPTTTPASHQPSLSPAWKRRKRSLISSIVHLPALPSLPSQRRSPLFCPSIAAPLPHLVSPSLPYPREERLAITEDAAALVFVGIPASSLFPAYMRCRKRIRPSAQK